MFYLFSSDATRKYKTDILDVICYPENHIFRFRYQEQYVSDKIKNWQRAKAQLKMAGTHRSFGKIHRKLKEQATLLDSEKMGVVVYAETTGDALGRDFNFYPVRQVEIERVFVEGSVYYVDFRLGQFVNYGRGEAADTKKREYHDKLKEIPLPMRPLPYVPKGGLGKVWHIEQKQLVDSQDFNRKETTSGYFFSSFDDVLAQSLTRESSSQAWESVADVLSRSESMKSCIFYLITGFYKVVKTFRPKRTGRLQFKRKHVEKLIRGSDDDWSTKYPIRMGTSVVLKLLFFRSEDSPNIFPQELTINTDTEVLAGVSQTRVLLHSHYNEERIELAFKRTFDSILSGISIEHKPTEAASFQKQKTLAPQPFLLIKVTVPKRTLWGILILLFFTPILVTLGPDSVAALGNSHFIQGMSTTLGGAMAQNSAYLALAAKGIGGLLTLFAGYLAFRRLPIGR